MNRLLIVASLLVVLYLHTSAQDKPYKFPVPEGWQSETFATLIKFAPSIPFKGIEKLRFPQAGARRQVTNIGLVFVWYLDSKVTLSSAELKPYLQQYYTVLYLTNPGTNIGPAEPFTQADLKRLSGQCYGYGLNADFLSGGSLLLYIKIA